MPRRFDDDDDYPRAVPKKSNTGLIIALVVGGILLLVVVGCGGLLMFGWMSAARVAEKIEQEEKAKAELAITRVQFQTLVLNKTPDEVIAAVGKPDSTQQAGQGDPIWYYKKRTKDPLTGKLDVHAQVIFEKGKVARVSY
jgi:hypothetical protein